MEVAFKATLQRRIQRARGSLGIAVQAAVAAGFAWFIAYNLMHHPQPYFAPISAVATLAVSIGQRMRRAVEIVLGNAFGILLGEALILVIGRGAWQISLVVVLAILVAIFAGGGPSLVMQSAAGAVLVVAVIPTNDEYLFSRFVDAIVGGSVGLAVMALVLPQNPLTVVSRAAGPLLDDLADGVRLTAEALEHRDRSKAEEALTDLREAEKHLTAFEEALTAASEIATLSPIRWGKRGALAQYVDGQDHIARCLRNSRVLIRRSVSVIRDEEPVPTALVSSLRSLADTIRWVHREYAEELPPDASREAAVRSVRNASDAYLSGLGFSGSVIVAQVRSMATDLLRAGGMESREAERDVRRAVGKASSKPPPPAPKHFTQLT
ncbi:FUSC family protein [Hamadaea sp. NPDC051192]|uniref:FUSC family protein n=1 Tax=Hamadaea sp. NPDC051192 TaxID=3154940 RepID=UPI00343C0D8B